MKRLWVLALGVLALAGAGCSDPVEEAEAIYTPPVPSKPVLLREIEPSPFVDSPADKVVPQPAQDAKEVPPPPANDKTIRLAQKASLKTPQLIGSTSKPPVLNLDVSKIKKPDPVAPAVPPAAAAEVGPVAAADATDEPVKEESPAETPAPEKPAEEKPEPEKPEAEKPAAQEPAAQEPAAQEPAANEDVSPDKGATSDSKEEAGEVGAWVGTGSTRLSVVKEGDFPLAPAAGKFALKASAGKSKSAVVKTQKESPPFESKARYQVSFKVLSRIDPYTCSISLMGDKKTSVPATDPASKSDKWELVPDKWNAVEAIVEVPDGDDPGRVLQFEFSGVPKSSWYLDDVRIVKVAP